MFVFILCFNVGQVAFCCLYRRWQINKTNDAIKSTIILLDFYAFYSSVNSKIFSKSTPANPTQFKKKKKFLNVCQKLATGFQSCFQKGDCCIWYVNFQIKNKFLFWTIRRNWPNFFPMSQVASSWEALL